MPIDMAPPSANIQGYQIAPPQSVDPLQTLAQMGELRQQALKNQAGQMELQQQQLLLQDQQAMRQAMQQWDGKNPDDLFDGMREAGVSPTTLLDVKGKLLDQKAKLATLDKDQLANVQTRNTQAQSLLAPVADETDPAKQEPLWNQAVTSAAQQGLLRDPAGNPLTAAQALAQHPYPGTDGVDHYIKSLNLENWLTKQEKTSTIAKTNIDIGNLKRGQAIQEIQAASDPATGIPSAADYAAIRQKYPDVSLPSVPTQANIAQLAKSTVPVEKQPEFDIKSAQARLGLMGDSEWDQYLLRYAQSIHKTPATLLPDEYFAGVQKYAEDKKDPVLRANAIAQTQLALAMRQMQMNMMPTPEQAQQVANDLVNNRIAPDQLTQLLGSDRSGNFKRMVYGEAKKQDPNFNFEQASADYQYAKSPGFQNTVRFMDSAMEGLPRLLANAQKVANGGITSINQLLNAGKRQFQDVDLAKLHADVLLESDEIAKILSGGGTNSATSDAKLQAAQSLMRDEDNPQKLAGVLGEVQALIGYRRGALTKGTYLENSTPAPSGGKVAPPVGFTKQFKDGTTRAFSGKLPASDINNWTVVKVK